MYGSADSLVGTSIGRMPLPPKHPPQTLFLKPNPKSTSFPHTTAHAFTPPQRPALLSHTLPQPETLTLYPSPCPTLSHSPLPRQQRSIDFSYLFTPTRPGSLSARDQYRYYTLSPKHIPEAYDNFYTRISERADTPDPNEDPLWQDLPKPRHGCLGLQQELYYSHGNSILYRPFMWHL